MVSLIQAMISILQLMILGMDAMLFEAETMSFASYPMVFATEPVLSVSETVSNFVATPPRLPPAGDDSSIILARLDFPTISAVLLIRAIGLPGRERISSLCSVRFLGFTGGMLGAVRLSMKVRDLIKLIQKNGWSLVRVKGDHAIITIRASVVS